MWFFAWIKERVAENKNETAVLAVCVLAVAIAGIVCMLGGRTGVYLAFASALGGGLFLSVYYGILTAQAGAYIGAVTAIGLGSSYLYASCICALRHRARVKKQRRLDCLRRIEYALPDKDNSYIRARLHTVLQAPSEENGAKDGAQPVRLGYARKLLAKVLEAPLSAAERLQAEDIKKTFALYLAKEKWDSDDLRTVNDTFSCLLKLSAKYAVAV